MTSIIWFVSTYVQVNPTFRTTWSSCLNPAGARAFQASLLRAEPHQSLGYPSSCCCPHSLAKHIYLLMSAETEGV